MKKQEVLKRQVELQERLIKAQDRLVALATKKSLYVAELEKRLGDFDDGREVEQRAAPAGHFALALYGESGEIATWHCLPEGHGLEMTIPLSSKITIAGFSVLTPPRPADERIEKIREILASPLLNLDAMIDAIEKVTDEEG